MRSRLFKIIVVLLVAGILLCVSDGAYAHADADDCHCHGTDSCHHCVMHTNCHSAGLPANGFPLFFSVEHPPTVATETVKLPLVLELITIPPKR